MRVSFKGLVCLAALGISLLSKPLRANHYHFDQIDISGAVPGTQPDGELSHGELILVFGVEVAKRVIEVYDIDGDGRSARIEAGEFTNLRNSVAKRAGSEAQQFSAHLPR